jgi:deoxyribodipyrimidine photo-lyase
MRTISASRVPALRVTAVNRGAVRPEGELVLYWMIAARRVRSSFALERAAEWAETLGRPLLVLEALRCDYRWASDRLHAFVLAGMADNAGRLAGRGVAYYPYVEPERGAGRGLLAALAAHACVVVTDESPAFFLPRMVAAAAAGVPVLMEQVDGTGLLPLRAAERGFATAFAFRRFLQQELPRHLEHVPADDPLAGRALPGPIPLPAEVASRWLPADPALLRDHALLARLPLDHTIAPARQRGGSAAAEAAVRSFTADGLAGYDQRRNAPIPGSTSNLSPYLHFGHLSPHQVLAAVAAAEGWSPHRLPAHAGGKRSGWWQMSPAAESFLDQLVTWRELAFNTSARRDDVDRWESLPAWARRTLEDHRRDPRPYLYGRAQLEAAETHDPLWNAAQQQLRREGRIYGYLRMLWGKKILEWSPAPEDAFETMLELNNAWALDGRDPNSSSGIGWVLGRYDRPWGPERPIFGTVRYMSSASAARKLDLRPYLRAYAP